MEVLHDKRAQDKHHPITYEAFVFGLPHLQLGRRSVCS